MRKVSAYNSRHYDPDQTMQQRYDMGFRDGYAQGKHAAELDLQPRLVLEREVHATIYLCALVLSCVGVLWGVQTLSWFAGLGGIALVMGVWVFIKVTEWGYSNRP